eukprot:GAHX01001393.1.p1 GENE.GAHX01001393.1~~GAHX01001393.1.p1  ORF type:complete len:313 (+),score=43.78 GAHX01001393.1:296-1234(+)
MVGLISENGMDIFIHGPPGSGKTFFARTNLELSMQQHNSACIKMLDNNPQKALILEAFRDKVVIQLNFKKILSRQLGNKYPLGEIEKKFYINLIYELHSQLLKQLSIKEEDANKLNDISIGNYPDTKNKIDSFEKQFNEYLLQISKFIEKNDVKKTIQEEGEVLSKVIIIADEVNAFRTKGIYSHKLGPKNQNRNFFLQMIENARTEDYDGVVQDHIRFVFISVPPVSKKTENNSMTSRFTEFTEATDFHKLSGFGEFGLDHFAQIANSTDQDMTVNGLKRLVEETKVNPLSVFKFIDKNNLKKDHELQIKT